MNYYYLFITIPITLFIVSEIFPFCSSKYNGIFHCIIYKIIESKDKINNKPLFIILKNEEDIIKSNNDFENQV